MNAGQGIYAVLWNSPREYRSSRARRYWLFFLRYRGGHNGVAEQNQEHDHHAQHRRYLTNGQRPIRPKALAPLFSLVAWSTLRPKLTNKTIYLVITALTIDPVPHNSPLEQPHVA